jgi:hypothetical protein
MTVDLDPNPPSAPYLDMEYGINAIIELLDKYDINGTFFVPACTALTYGKLIREISSRGHEIGCHGIEHNPKEVYKPINEQFKLIEKATSILSSVTGSRPLGYRAPLFKITTNCLLSLLQNNYVYDSSFVPSPFFCNYRDFEKLKYYSKPFFINISEKEKLIEIPISVNPLFLIPLGGAYLRIFGYNWGKCCIKYNFINRRPVVLYIHPKDLIPRRYGLAWYSYRNTEKCISTIENLIKYSIRMEANFVRAIELAESLNKF